jgi:hypothetical protein
MERWMTTNVVEDIETVPGTFQLLGKWMQLHVPDENGREDLFPEETNVKLYCFLAAKGVDDQEQRSGIVYAVFEKIEFLFPAVLMGY